ncbi:unnamed protein product [Timema podura]|uniref:Ethylmalonyl-CoA decarboxylase n=1 Tax=Timema podura TaxID=61482 RepID=A0ABN7P2H6_TIMPD|nr:unnamed protein product [Timema podura]
MSATPLRVSSCLNSCSTFPESSMAEIRHSLQQYKGGSIDLTLDDDTSIATLCLNHPEKKNAISGQMMADLEDSVNTLERWSQGKGVILYGSNGMFCSGGDLDMVRQISNPDDGYRMASFMQHLLDRLQKLPIISLALIEGSGALGGGAELAISCDYRLLTSSAAGIGFVHARMGIAPAWGGGIRLVHTVGPHQALDLLLTARVVPPQEAVKIGLVSSIIDSEDGLGQATKWLCEKTKFDTTVVRAIKEIVSNARDDSNCDLLSEERKIFAPLWGGPANKAALLKNIRHIENSKM